MLMTQLSAWLEEKLVSLLTAGDRGVCTQVVVEGLAAFLVLFFLSSSK